MKDKLTQVQKCHSLINSHGFRNILAQNIALNIAKGTTDPGIDCFYQINNSKLTEPLLKPLNFIQITEPLLSFQIHWSQILEISRNKLMLVCLIRLGLVLLGRLGLVCQVWFARFGLVWQVRFDRHQAWQVWFGRFSSVGLDWSDKNRQNNRRQKLLLQCK